MCITLRVSSALGLLLVAAITFLNADEDTTPQVMMLSGYLTDKSGGTGVPADGLYTMMFEVCDAEIGGSCHPPVTVTQVPVTNGFYEVELQLDLSNFYAGERWIQITIDGELLSPRTKIGSVPYAYNADRVDGAEAFELDQGAWLFTHETDPDIHVNHAPLEESAEIVTALSAHESYPDIHVNHAPLEESAEITAALSGHENDSAAHSSEIGTAVSTHASDASAHGNWVKKSGDWMTGALNIYPPSGTSSIRLLSGTQTADWTVGANDVSGALNFYDANRAMRALAISAEGYLGVNNGWPLEALHIGDRFTFHNGLLVPPFTATMSIGNNTRWDGTQNVRLVDGTATLIRWQYDGDFQFLTAPHDVAGTTITWEKPLVLKNTGEARVKILEITGGLDLAEPFHIADGLHIEPGTVMSIDSNRPGELTITKTSYDTKVAGCVSGANGINPGVVLKQEELLAPNAHPVALSGRVFCLADASYGPIVEGDLLTTSDTAGHAMRVTDHTRARGAIIGKAMSRLVSGQGFVLVLVSLQ